jgi:hypothetical protein
MADYESLTNNDILEGLQQTKAAKQAAETHLNYLLRGRGLPLDPLAREEMQEGFTRLIKKLTAQESELDLEWQRRR